MNGIVRADQKLRTDTGQFVRRSQHQLAHALPIVAAQAFDILAERVRMHRHLGMGVRAEELRAFSTDRAIAKRGAFGGAGDDTDMLRHARKCITMAHGE